MEVEFVEGDLDSTPLLQTPQAGELLCSTVTTESPRAENEMKIGLYSQKPSVALSLIKNRAKQR
jgi:hypothetical protein